jgi:hypothetical protein
VGSSLVTEVEFVISSSWRWDRFSVHWGQTYVLCIVGVGTFCLCNQRLGQYQKSVLFSWEMSSYSYKILPESDYFAKCLFSPVTRAKLLSSMVNCEKFLSSLIFLRIFCLVWLFMRNFCRVWLFVRNFFVESDYFANFLSSLIICAKYFCRVGYFCEVFVESDYEYFCEMFVDSNYFCDLYVDSLFRY